MPNQQKEREQGRRLNRPDIWVASAFHKGMTKRPEVGERPKIQGSDGSRNRLCRFPQHLIG
jgi:hypothetical protein